MRSWAFSEKQKTVLRWWCGPEQRHDAIICDGAVRSGKTFCMGLSFVCWAMARFQGAAFGLCGKTTVSLRRNLVRGLVPVLEELGFRCEEKVSRSLLTVRRGGRENTFYFFGGKDEGSAALIQGVTLAGVLLDEAALMPRSFVEQACARCSVAGSRLWFNCNPEGPEHWFYKEWIQKAEARNALYLHFTMEDNPGLRPEIRERYSRMFSGAFYRRFVLGEWAAAEGRVYDFFDETYLEDPPDGLSRWCISCDYGTVNPASFGLWGWKDGVWYRVKEFYYDSREKKRQKTDGEYAQDLRALAGGRDIRLVVVDPSAASFIEVLRRDGLRVVKAENNVLSGIRTTAELLREKKLVICRGCDDALREFQLYCWAEGGGQDRVRKEHDHAMDEIRYFAATVAAGREPPYLGAAYVERARF
ncbi:PBSX family phage terminase large subunit [Pseudoflavonifractor capillosus]|uniref:PBSX family phage terminase large subunit n=1 Tax=Pseudoflavonifractor capillosus TaxID=106588 RepID=A0A921MNC5_9FIRM|nr:PBSX family phage terminase large subunit [Pseudoflavonifractor capillosus]HJG86989.1 PBSX family phage terminase large subunit [Pseudoflavonifractor capillosus]